MATREIYTTTFDEDVQTTTECPDCDSSVRTATGETVCEVCGLVLEDTQLDRDPDWNRYDEQTEKRTGAPLTPTRHDRGLSTEIGRYRDGHGNSLSSRKRRQLNRLRRETRTRGD
ncbi:TFIIB-type zinc ribbon-containing protein [Halomontanus rarus]|uniref:TFIIB-type zinc ribbon-containing protein n=1 Tax=Halomontanus rarus TaxID=3034020 RepID=UPI003CE508D4